MKILVSKILSQFPILLESQILLMKSAGDRRRGILHPVLEENPHDALANPEARSVITFYSNQKCTALPIASLGQIHPCATTGRD